MQISGYMFPVELNPELDAVFLPFTTSWGWATWQRAWKQYDPLMSGFSLLKQDRKLRKLFNLDGSYPYFEMLESPIKGKIDSWAIRWYLNTFMLNGLILHPSCSCVINLGFDGSGTHCSYASASSISLTEKIDYNQFPDSVEGDANALKNIIRYLYKSKYFQWLSFLKSLYFRSKILVL